MRLEYSALHPHVNCFKWAVTAAAIGYGVYVTLKLRKQHVNACVKKDCDKVVEVVDVEDLGKQTVFCRCWKSKKFPYCDGTHNTHNKATGDNVGPIVVNKK